MEPSLLLDAISIGSTLAAATGWLLRPRAGLARLARPVVALGAAFPWLYVFALRPWHRRWSVTDEERRLTLPGDVSVPAPGYEHTRAVTVHAPAERVWPWLAQIGQDRTGFYAYDRLENLAGCDVHSAGTIYPEWQLRPGDTLHVLPGYGPQVVAAGPLAPGYALVIAGWGTYALRPVDARTSRLIAPARQPHGPGALGYLLTFEIPHFIMERAMLRGIKARAENAESSSSRSPMRRPSRTSTRPATRGWR